MLVDRGKACWVSKVRATLYRYGFGYVWENPGAQNLGKILCVEAMSC